MIVLLLIIFLTKLNQISFQYMIVENYTQFHIFLTKNALKFSYIARSGLKSIHILLYSKLNKKSILLII